MYPRPWKVASIDITSGAGKKLAVRLGIDIAPALVRLHDGIVVARVTGRLPNPREWRILLEAPSDG